ncbi:polysaccharide biosynthesis protein [Alkalihalobacillus hemicellulosilyticus]|uniref:UDP-N-acetylglucosamine 4,6-dehydratase n=1 Tax=Halalkalibacter hemicellulosilyticusJCM 9152 TaxID=1236971 RepID=W4QH65_9BACI|nr:polysaccharide biosynthesis protein [Halalkalibacter hemicellulosilyticus]GAE30983.1 UDP-N-acetylglucosamine 4,6-dehydratase [Halalkalibacter hemicellulosilyticusJCM 9152]
MFQNKTILVTGGTGSWGYELVKKLLHFNPKEIHIFSRNEYAQVKMNRMFSDYNCLKYVIGDVRDFEAVSNATKEVDYVFHLAALKHVPVCEDQPLEAIKTNIIGTENIIKASIHHGVKKVIDVSTDKAVDPVNLYGLTKAVGEKLIIQANQLSKDTRFVCIRGGNVIGTNGSAIPFFKEQIIHRHQVPLTSKEMTRFFLTVSQAIDLLLKASEIAIGGETFVMKMKSCRIVDLIRVLEEQYATKGIEIKEIGIRPGEKLHEVLISNYESKNTYKFDEEYYVILPSHPSDNLVKKYSQLPKVLFNKYQSNDELMSLSEIEKILKKANVHSS